MSLDKFGLESGAPTRTRTADLLITNQLLYQLSYRGFRRLFKQTVRQAQEPTCCFLPKVQLPPIRPD